MLISNLKESLSSSLPSVYSSGKLSRNTGISNFLFVYWKKKISGDFPIRINSFFIKFSTVFFKYVVSAWKLKYLKSSSGYVEAFSKEESIENRLSKE